MEDKAPPELIAEILNPPPVKSEPHISYFIFMLSLFLFPPLTCYYIYKYPYYYKWAAYLLWLSALSSLLGPLLSTVVAPKLVSIYQDLGSVPPPNNIFLDIILTFTAVIQIILAIYLNRHLKIPSPSVKKLLLITFAILSVSLLLTGYAISQMMTSLINPLYNFAGYLQ